MNKMAIRSHRIKYLSVPAVVIVAIVTQIPLIFTLGLSFVRWIVVRPDQGIRFVGLDNYVRIFTSGEFYTVILHTIFLTVVSLSLCLLLGIALGLMLNRRFLGVNIVRTMVVAPFFVMDAVVGIIWKTLMLHSSFGFNAFFSRIFGIAPVDFLGAHSMMTIIMLVVWQWTPFFVLIILAGLQSVPQEVGESARVDGAGWLKQLIFITLPIIWHHIEVAILLGLIFILKVFGIIFVTTSGGPGVSSTNLPYHVYKTAFLGWNVGQATTLAIITVFITLAAIMALFHWFRNRLAEAK